MSGVPILYEAMFGRSVFTTDEAVASVPQTREQTIRQLNYLKDEGYVVKVRKGLWLLVPLDQKGRTPAVNPLLLASKVTPDYGLCYHSALELHGVAHSSFSEVQVVTRQDVRSFAFDGVTYSFMRVPELLFQRHPLGGPSNMQQTDFQFQRFQVEGQPVRATDREWTFIMCSMYPEKAGGLAGVLQSVEGFPYIDTEKVFVILEHLRVAVAYNRVGWVLSRFEDAWEVPDAHLRRFQSMAAKQRDGNFVQTSQTRHDKDYNVAIPLDLEAQLRHA